MNFINHLDINDIYSKIKDLNYKIQKNTVNNLMKELHKISIYFEQITISSNSDEKIIDLLNNTIELMIEKKLNQFDDYESFNLGEKIINNIDGITIDIFPHNNNYNNNDRHYYLLHQKNKNKNNKLNKKLTDIKKKIESFVFANFQFKEDCEKIINNIIKIKNIIKQKLQPFYFRREILLYSESLSEYLTYISNTLENVKCNKLVIEESNQVIFLNEYVHVLKKITMDLHEFNFLNSNTSNLYEILEICNLYKKNINIDTEPLKYNNISEFLMDNNFMNVIEKYPNESNLDNILDSLLENNQNKIDLDILEIDLSLNIEDTESNFSPDLKEREEINEELKEINKILDDPDYLEILNDSYEKKISDFKNQVDLKEKDIDLLIDKEIINKTTIKTDIHLYKN